MNAEKNLSLKYFKIKLDLPSCWISNMEKIFGRSESLVLSMREINKFLHLLILIKFNNTPTKRDISDFFENECHIAHYSYSNIGKKYLFLVNCQCAHHAKNYFEIPHFEIYPILQIGANRYLRIASELGTKVDNIKDALFQHSCRPEIVRVTKYDNILHGVFGDLNMITKMEGAPLLDEKEKSDIARAFEEGYYDFPRKKNVLEIAEKFGIPRSTYQLHVRKAESKIIKNYLKHLIS
ncbi:MAG: helix-turn-helix domain-containing protein [Theionarchaea archaeon]|nr:helix-turn-helix domain-containing protein [Theionarchaea archaeon]